MFKTMRNSLIVLAVAVIGFQFLGDDSFNCHNYAWETQRRWLEDPQSYIDVAIECKAADASRIVYFNDNTPIHSGLYLGAGWVQSKWGSNPVILHPIYLSTYGFNVRFYR